MLVGIDQHHTQQCQSKMMQYCMLMEEVYAYIMHIVGEPDRRPNGKYILHFTIHNQV